jgi:hypothetical protein
MFGTYEIAALKKPRLQKTPIKSKKPSFLRRRESKSFVKFLDSGFRPLLSGIKKSQFTGGVAGQGQKG